LQAWAKQDAQLFLASFRTGLEGKVYFAECGNLKRCSLRNFTCWTFRKLHLRVFPHSVFRKIQI